MHLTVTAAIVAGILGYFLFICFLCAILAVGKRKDQTRLEIWGRLDCFAEALKNRGGQPQVSDCPALSAILATAASVGLVRAGTDLVLANSPHSPLVLELTGAPTNSDALLLLAYHCRVVENCLVRESEMAFEICQLGCEYLLRVVSYSPAQPHSLVPFALLWSEELTKRGYIGASQSRWRKARAA
jgi:hypothetical protein